MELVISNRLLEALDAVDRPLDFCVSGKLPIVLPGLTVAGKEIALPLTDAQASALKKLAHQAPFGKGQKTLVDTKVRRVWEIDTSEVKFGNPGWNELVQTAVAATQLGLGLGKQKLTAHFYKLLVYDKGSFFVSHRDSEKIDRMVGTLIISLPSAHRGGALVVHHDGKSTTVDFGGPQSAFDIRFAAFYADCEHEVKPVTSGHRLVLAYNLTLAKSKKGLGAPTIGSHVDTVARLLEQEVKSAFKQTSPSDRAVGEAVDRIEDDDDEEDEEDEEDEDNADGYSDEDEDIMPSQARRPRPPSKLAVLLDHAYTETGLKPDALKGTDRARAEVLFAAAERSGYDAALAFVTFEEVGATNEWGGDYGTHIHEEDETGEEDWEMDEVIESGLTGEHFVDASGKALGYGSLPLDDDEIVTSVRFADRQPNRQELDGYLGNEGVTLRRWYHAAAIVLWPAANRFDVLCEGGVRGAVGGLERMVADWKKTAKAKKEAARDECVRFASRILAHWTPVDEYGFPDASSSQSAASSDPAVRLLKAIVAIGEDPLVSRWIREVLKPTVHLSPGPIFAKACAKVGWVRCADDVRRLFAASGPRTFLRDSALLADMALAKDDNDDRRQLCGESAGSLTAAIEPWNPVTGEWRERFQPKHLVEILSNLLKSMLTLGRADLLDRLVNFVLARKAFDRTTVQVAALRSLSTWLRANVHAPSAPLGRWLTILREELKSRVDSPPQPPADARRPADFKHNCKDCDTLRAFLQDSDVMTVRLPMAQHRRQHMHQMIDHNHLDSTHATERKGRPYVLVLKKTTGSFERAKKVHEQDIENLATIAELGKWHRRLGE